MTAMLDTTKHMDYFNPTNITDEIHVIGVGAIGSTIVEMLTRLGVESINIYDMDEVTPHNLANQCFRFKDIGKQKEEAIIDIAKEINPKIQITPHGEYNHDILSGYVFMCVDSMDVRRQIVETNQYQIGIKALIDFRMGLDTAQAYTVIWKEKNIATFQKTMAFENADANKNVPKNACGMELSIIPTVRSIVSIGLANWIDLIKTDKCKSLQIVKLFQEYGITNI